LIPNRKVFTLLEALITIVIFTIGVGSVVWSFSAGVFAASTVGSTETALNIAQATMEEIKDLDYATIVSIGDTRPTADPNFTDFDTTIDIAKKQDPMQIDVTVSWDTKGGAASVTLTTLVADL